MSTTVPASVSASQTNPAAPSAPLIKEPADGGRLISLDVYRGLTIASMILVTDPGTYSHRFAPLCHAEWMGATATDMIFPAFLFITGVSLTLSFARRREHGATRSSLAWHALRRCVLLILLGLAVNGFPLYHWSTLRLPGILQRIGICYLLAALLYLWADREERSFRREAVIFSSIIVLVLAVYWWALLRVPVPGFGVGHLDSNGNLPAYLDRRIFRVNHLWPWGLTPGVGVTYDSEGVLSTFPALCTVLLGIVAGSWMRTAHRPWQKIAGLAVAGVLLLSAGSLLSPWLPINKRIYTSTFALLSGGVSLLLFALFYALVDRARSRWWTPAALVFGTNAILAFVVSSVLTSAGSLVHVAGANGKPMPLYTWLYLHCFAPWLSPINASLAYALVVVGLNGLLVLPFYRKRIFLRL